MVGVVDLGYRRLGPSSFCQARGGRPFTAGSPTAVVIGDSYSSGFLLSDRRDAWPVLLGRDEHWQTYVEAVPGTGVTNVGTCQGQDFLSRLPMALAHHPQILIAQTGLNDGRAAPGTVRAKAMTLLERASRVPYLVVVGPPPAPALTGAKLQRVDAELSAACRPPHCRYVSALHWQLVGEIGQLHLTPAGHGLFAADVAAALREGRST